MEKVVLVRLSAEETLETEVGQQVDVVVLFILIMSDFS